MTQEIDLGGTIYISSKLAAEKTGYTQDYIGQLARAGSIDAKRISGLWYVHEDSLRNHRTKADEYVPTPPPKKDTTPELESAVSFDGKDYISAQRASKITGYAADYVGQLARSGKVVSRQIGNRWYVDRAGIVEHKKHNDALLAAVQAESVGLQKLPAPEVLPKKEENEVFFNYSQEPLREPFPDINAIQPTDPAVKENIELESAVAVPSPTVIQEPSEPQMPEMEPSTEIPIRVIHDEIARDPLVIAPKKIETFPTEIRGPQPRIAMFIAAFVIVIMVGGGIALLTGVFRGGNGGGVATVPESNKPASNVSKGPLGAVRNLFSREIVYVRPKDL